MVNVHLSFSSTMTYKGQTVVDALAGINGGDGVRSVTVPGSLSEAIMNITTTSNVGRPGVWMYRVDTDGR